METTLHDEQGALLTRITIRAGAGGRVLVDRTARPDLLFRHYFDDGQRNVTLVHNERTYTAALGTRWQMGRRFWFLEQCRPADMRSAQEARSVPLGGAALLNLSAPPAIGRGS